MKKIFALVFAVVLSFAGMVAFISAPAQAGESSKITICHATGKPGKYVSQTVDKNSIVKGNGGHGQSGVNDGDIIPPFTYNFGGNNSGSYPGNNWPGDIEGNQLIANNCIKAEPKVVTPVAPTFVQPTCLDTPDRDGNRLGKLTLATQPEGVILDVATPRLQGNPGAGIWMVNYVSADPTKYTVTNGMFSFKIDNLTSDPMWSIAANNCNLPDTGMSAGTSNALMVTGGLVVFAGALLIFASRRKTVTT